MLSTYKLEAITNYIGNYMQLCRVRKNTDYMECTYKKIHWTWKLYGDYGKWDSFTKIDDRFLVPIPAHFSTPSVS